MRQHALHQSQDVLRQTHTAAHPAHRSGKLDGVAAQLIGSRHQTRRLLGSRYDLFQFCEGSWQPRCQAIRQQAEGGVRFSAIPARYLRAHRRPARIGAVARQRASATRVIRTPFGHRSSLASRHPSALTFCSPVCNVWNRSCTDRGPAGGVPRGPFSPYRLILQGYPASGNRQVSSTVHGCLDLPTATRFLPSSQSFRRRPMRRNAYYEDPARSGSLLAPVRAASHSRRREHPPHRLPGGVSTAFPWVCRSRRGTASQTESKD